MPDPRRGVGARSYDAVQQRLSAGSATRQLPAALLPECQLLPNMAILSVASLFAEAVHRIHEGESISSLFSDELTYG